jgi:hypothetical protein
LVVKSGESEGQRLSSHSGASGNAGQSRRTAYEPYGLDIVLNSLKETIGLKVFTDDVCALLCAPFFATSSSRLSPGLKLLAECMTAVSGRRVPVATVTRYRFRTPDGKPRTVLLRSSYVSTGATLGREDVLRAVTRLGRGYTGGYVALAGVVPSLIKRYGLENAFPPHFLLAQDASALMVKEAALRRCGECDGQRITVIGIGDLGRLVADLLHQDGRFHIAAYDINPQVLEQLPAGIERLSTHEQLAQTDLFVLLSGTGDSGLKTVLQAARPRTTVLSDTYPKISRQMTEQASKAQVRICDVHYEIAGGRWDKAFAGFERNAVPGCLALALALGLGTGETLEEKIRSIGLQVVVVDRNA